MKRSSTLAIGALVLCCFGFKAMAQDGQQDTVGGFFLEPAVTYELGKTKTNFPSPLSDSTGTVEGFGLGLRIGFHLDKSFFMGLDGRYGVPEFEDSSVNYSASATTANWGPVVGLQMPHLGLRLWGTYIVGGEMNPDASNGLNISLAEASGYRFGAGFHIEMFSLNLEYQQLDYGNVSVQELGPFSGNTSFNGVKQENKGWIVSFSFPMAFNL